MATKTYGAPGTPSVKTINFDAVFTQSLANYRKTLTDQISESNSFYKRIKNSGSWTTVDGGTNIEIPLMIALGSPDTFDGYDLLDTTPMDGVTMALFDFRQVSVPVTISGKEQRNNKGVGKLVDMLSTKLQQAEMGLQEFFNKMLLQGNKVNGGNLVDPYVSPINGSLGVDPLPLLIHFDPTAAVDIGNIDQNANNWWRNQTQDVSVDSTTTTELIRHIETLINNCSKGPGGVPDIAICDQTTFEWLKTAIYHRTRHEAQTTADWPFENVMFRRTMFVWDEQVPDVANNLADTGTEGTIFMVNSKFFSVKTHKDANFVSSEFVRPANQDAKISQIMWQGGVCVSNRRKHGVAHGIPRTFTIS